jgi:cytochrome P450
MTRYPDIQAKAREELDAVVGVDRLPKLSDRGQLPYLEAIINEVYRFTSVAPLVPHQSNTDDVHNGFLLPKGTMVIANTWYVSARYSRDVISKCSRYMSRDPRVYVDPHVFRPSRFLGSNPEMDPREYIFGFGRCVCPGRRFADDNVFLACAMILATLDIKRACDSEGNEILPEIEFEGAAVKLVLFYLHEPDC